MQGYASANRLRSGHVGGKIFFRIGTDCGNDSPHRVGMIDRVRIRSRSRYRTIGDILQEYLGDPRKAWVCYAVNPFSRLCLAALIL